MHKKPDIANCIDLDQYPIQDLLSPQGRKFADSCRKKYLDAGLCMLQGFIRPGALQELATEANGFSDHAYFCESKHDAYLSEDDGICSEDNADRRQEHTFCLLYTSDAADE